MGAAGQSKTIPPIDPALRGKDRADYVNNKDFLKAVSEYRVQYYDAKEKGLEKPMISRYIAECIMKICTRLSYRPNFMNYSYREEFVGDGIDACIAAVHLFNPEKTNNPFAYFTTVAFTAFVRRINQEKKQSYIRAKIASDLPSEEFLSLQDQDDAGEYKNMYVEFIKDNNSDIITSFENKKEMQKQEKIKKKLEKNAQKSGNLGEFLE